MKTIAFDEKNNGWEGFFSFNPDDMISLNNSFYSFRDGNLHEHETNETRRSFYGNISEAKITTVINQASQFDKVFKTLEVESNKSWSVEIKTNLTHGRVENDEFSLRESRWFAHLRKNEDDTDFSDNAVCGIGNCTSALQHFKLHRNTMGA